MSESGHGVGVLPPNWIWSTLGEIGYYLNGRGFKKSEWSEQGRPIIRIQDLTGSGGTPNYFEGEADPRHEVQDGDLLVSWAATLGAYVWRGPDAVLNQHIFKVQSFVDRLFHYYLTLSILGDLYRQSHGSGMVHVTKGRFEATRIPLPPLDEQRRIVEAIETQLTRLDAAVEALERVKTNLKRYRASVLKAACEGRLVPTEASVARAEGREYETGEQLLQRILKERRERWEAEELAKMRAKGREPKDDRWKARYKKPPAPDTSGLPPLPEGWVWSTMAQLGRIGTGSTPLRSNPDFYEGGSIPWTTSGAANRSEVREPEQFVTEAAVAAHRLRLYPPHTLLVAMYGEGRTRGKCSELMVSSTINQALAAVVMDGGASARARPYTKLFLESNYEQARRAASGGVQPNLSLSLVGRTAVPLPPLAEQQRVLAEAERLLTVSDTLTAAVEAALQRAGRLRQAVLKRAFEGRLVSQDPNDEPASVLLERIRAERAAEPAKARRARRSRRSAVADARRDA